MSLKSRSVPQRRRGEALEEALLEAAWAELADRGYDQLTFEAVAARAGTSRAVLYRRWPSKPELVHATLEHELRKDRPAVPDTGTLRGDLLTMMRRTNDSRLRLAAVVLTRLGDFYQESGLSLSELRVTAQGRVDEIFHRAVVRGEIDPDRLTERITRLPYDLLRNEIVMTLRPIPDAVIEEIVDTIVLPLVTRDKSR